MGTYAVMGGDTVTNVIVADDPIDASNALGVELIEYTSDNPAGVGWTYDKETNTFTPPALVDQINSGTQKLIDAGLTQEEINALIYQASQNTLQTPIE
jgi:hypothetical protein